MRVQRHLGAKVLKIDRPSAGGFLGLTALRVEGCGIAEGGRCAAQVQRVQRVQKVQRGRYRPVGDEYIVSVTGLTFVSPVLHDEEP